MDYDSGVEGHDALPSASAQANLDGVVLSEVSQTEKDQCHRISHKHEKTRSMNKQKRNRLRDTEDISTGARWEGVCTDG